MLRSAIDELPPSLNQMPRRILYLIPNADLGGAEKATLAMMTHHDAAKYEPFSLFLRDGPLVRETSQRGIPTRVLGARVRLSRPQTVVRASLELARLIRSEKIAAVHFCMSYSHIVGGLAARAAGAKICVFQHGPVGTTWDRVSSLLPSDHIFTNSHFVLEKQARLNWQRTPMSIVYLATGEEADDDVIVEHRRRVDEMFELDPDAVVIGIVARFDPGKGIDVALRAAAPLLREDARLRFMIIGGPYAGFHPGYGDHLRALVQEERLQNQVIFAGFHRETTPLLCRLDILIQASTWELGFGLTVVEGMQLGKAVVATESSSEIVSHLRTGVLYPAGDQQRLSESLRMVAGDRELRLRLGNAAREAVRSRFSTAKMMKAIETTYDGLLGG